MTGGNTDEIFGKGPGHIMDRKNSEFLKVFPGGNLHSTSALYFSDCI